MCGIAGIVASDTNAIIDADRIHQMCDAIVYRGPDDEGVFVNGCVGLGMRRLSIIDVAGGQQPVHNEDKSVWIVFNGEIYNFLELRRDLEAKGHIFYTHSDTEAIVHSYEEYGAAFVAKLRGMFALALYDFRQHKLILARDRMGKKPLHYAVHNGCLYFCSEIKSVLAVAPELGGVDNDALAQFFFYGYIPDPATAFKAVRKLPPGHWLEFTNGNARVRQYWDIPEFCSSGLAEKECLEELEATLEDSVRMRLISEVPLGALLSGGVDSSAVVAMMARCSNRPVKTFSIGFKDMDFDESRHARAVAKRFGTEHCELIIEAKLWETLEELSRVIDEPFADSSIIPTYHVSRMARQYVTVVLSGDGGDELFAGYDSYWIQYARRYLDLVPRWIGPLYHRFIYPRLPLKLRTRKMAYNFPLGFAERFTYAQSLLASYDDDTTVLSRQFLDAVSRSEPPKALLRSYFERAPASDVVSRMQYADMKMYLTADVLTKVDRMSMFASLEVRCPLLDHVMVELATRLPLSMKFHGGVRKYLLRRLAEKIGVPRETLYRHKQGFSLPLRHWMRAELKAEVTDLLLEPQTIGRGYFRKSAVERLLREHHRGERDNSMVLWQLLAFELWNRNYLTPRTARPLSVYTDPQPAIS
ncbi:MAG TPA: asparagine synthase (glutamine-hydrolyzing) [Candidatus Acidoferrales bacterium]|nr:asparagine synthase (glutamine-hydrolyzing) [Candidatus Acidoferrales bacterium]